MCTIEFMNKNVVVTKPKKNQLDFGDLKFLLMKALMFFHVKAGIATILLIITSGVKKKMANISLEDTIPHTLKNICSAYTQIPSVTTIPINM
jgi:hypothetical protein